VLPGLASAILMSAAPARAVEPPEAAPRPAVTIRLVGPDRQLDRFLALFQGAKAPSPAAALAGWKRAPAAVGPGALTKRGEAILALGNPAMVRELRTLDGTEVAIGFDDAGRARWSATVPADDGTFAALATALALSGGGVEEAIGPARVDRLGPPGSALMAQVGATVVAAGTRPDLRAALDRLPLEPPAPGPGLRFRLDPAALGTAGPQPRGRLAAALRALGCREIRGDAGLDGESLALIVTGRWPDRPAGGRPLDPAWLDWLPADRTFAAVALALDPRPEAWDAAFAAADRVDKADPARAHLAPLRSRLNLLALAAGVRPEADLWPHLLGVSAAVTAEPSGPVDGALVALHLDGEAAAVRVADRVLPRLAARLRLEAPEAPAPAPDGVRNFGQLAGRPLQSARRGATLLIGWGEPTLPAAFAAQAHPDRSIGNAFRSARGPLAPRRAGACWPGRLPGLPADSPLGFALGAAPPVLWSGGGDGPATRDEVRWTGLRGVIRRFLDRLPMDPPPDRSNTPPIPP